MPDFFSPSSAQQSSSASSSTVSGLSPWARGELTHFLVAPSTTGNYDTSKGFLVPTTQALSKRASTPFEMPVLGSNGLYETQQGAFKSAMDQALSYFSGNAASRGFLNPNATGTIIGSAMQNVLPGLMPLIGNQTEQQKLAPENVTQSRIAQLLQMISQYPGLLGSQGTSVQSSQGTSTGAGLGYNLLGNFTSGVGVGAGKAAFT